MLTVSICIILRINSYKQMNFKLYIIILSEFDKIKVWFSCPDVKHTQEE